MIRIVRYEHGVPEDDPFLFDVFKSTRLDEFAPLVSGLVSTDRRGAALCGYGMDGA